MSKRVAAIHDLSGLGRCSLSAAIPVLSALGLQACPVPTAVLSCQTGFSRFHLTDGTEWMDHFIEDWRCCGLTPDGIYTGFLAGEAQVTKVERFLTAFRTPETLLVVDPVMGDGGRLYKGCTDELCRRMTALAAQADVITPNLTEACLLGGESYETFAADETTVPRRALELARRLAQDGRQVVITGVNHGDAIYNIAAGREEFLVKTPRQAGHFSGTGDLFASVVCGGYMRGLSLRQSVELATRLIAASITDTHGMPENGVEFERHLHLLTEV